MARGQRTYAYQSIPDVGPYGTATNRALPGPDTGPAIGSLFNNGFIPSVNPTIPAYSAPAAPEPAVTQSSLETCMLSGMSREACQQREAIAAELSRQANTQQNLGSGPGNEGYADSVTPGPATTAPVAASPEAPPVSVPEAPPPTFNEIDKAYDDPTAPQNQFQSKEDLNQPNDPAFENPNVPDTPTVRGEPKGEPTAEEDAAALAAANQAAIAQGFMNPDGTPGKGVTTTSSPISSPIADPFATVDDMAAVAPGLNNAISMTNVANSPVGSFAPGTPQGQMSPAQAAAVATAAAANATTQAGLATTGMPGSAYEGPVAPTAPAAPTAPTAPTTPQGLTQDDVDAAQAIAAVNALGVENTSPAYGKDNSIAVNSVEATTTPMSPAQLADVGQPAQQGWSTPGITAAQQADIGTAPTGPDGYAAVNAVSDQAQEAAALAAEVGISIAEANAALGYGDATTATGETGLGVSLGGFGPGVGLGDGVSVGDTGVSQGGVAAGPSGEGPGTSTGVSDGPSSQGGVSTGGDTGTGAVAGGPAGGDTGGLGDTGPGPGPGPGEGIGNTGDSAGMW